LNSSKAGSFESNPSQGVPSMFVLPCISGGLAVSLSPTKTLQLLARFILSEFSYKSEEVTGVKA